MIQKYNIKTVLFSWKNCNWNTQFSHRQEVHIWNCKFLNCGFFSFSGMILQTLIETTKHVTTWTRAQNQVFMWAKLWFTNGSIQTWSLMSQMYFITIPIPLAIWLTNTSNLNCYPVMLIWELEITLVRIQLVFI